MRKLAVLDFDGTIYNGDSMLNFAEFIDSKRYKRSLFKLLFPAFLRVFKLRSRDDLKRNFIRSNFKGKSRQQLIEAGNSFYANHFSRCYDKAVRYMVEAQANNTDLLILSGSCEEWLLPFSQKFEAQLICTQLDFGPQGICTGKLKSKNVVGAEKVVQLQTFLDGNEPYDFISAFGDKKSDALLSSIVTEYQHNYFA